jgi:hypothetical protein
MGSTTRIAGFESEFKVQCSKFKVRFLTLNF